MRLFKDYRSIPGFLMRRTVLHIKNVHIRIHDILSEDKTSYLHNHPFHYVSVILRGGYVEQLMCEDGKMKTIEHNKFSVICRTSSQYHRINNVQPRTRTLFLSWKTNTGWGLKRHDDIDNKLLSTIPDGMYKRTLNGKLLWARREHGFWHIGNADKTIAEKEKRFSIYQQDEYENKDISRV